MLRVHGLPLTLTAFITSMAVLFQSAMTSALTTVLPEIRAKPTIAAFSTFIVASFEKLDFRTTTNVVCMYPRSHLVMRAAASAPGHAKKLAQLPRVHYNFRQVVRLQR